MLRDDRQVALDDVIVALENAADAYADASELLEKADPEMSARFDELARRRAAAAARVTEHLRATGDLPSEPDQDLETVDVVIRHLKAQFAAPEWDELTTEALSREEEIAAKVEAATATGLPDPALDTLKRLEQDVRETIEALRRWRADHDIQ